VPFLAANAALTRSSSGDSSRPVRTVAEYLLGAYEVKGQSGLSIFGVRSLLMLSALLTRELEKHTGHPWKPLSTYVKAAGVNPEPATGVEELVHV
jgi:hypothetical protein